MKRIILILALLLMIVFIPNSVVEAQEMKLSDTDVVSYSTSTSKKVEDVILGALDSLQTQIDLSAYKISSSEFNKIYDSILDNNYRYFYVSGRSYMVYSGKITKVNFYYKFDKKTTDTMLKKYEGAISRALSGVDDNWSDIERLLYINDYLALNCEYDYTLSHRTAYDALVNKTAVCEGYAEAYKVLATELGIKCEIVSSRSLNHAWNMVDVGGKKYHVDPTWDDPYEDTLGAATHRYFLKSTANYQKHHYRENDWKVTGGWSSSSANTTTYDSYFWDDMMQAFSYSNGYWYAFDEGDLKKYQCDGSSFVEIGTELDREDIWPVVGLEEGHTGYWTDTYHGLGAYGEYLYFSTSDTI